jgi:FkbM family methyltransferase
MYHRLKASCVYDAYWTFADRRILEMRDAEVRFYRRLLQGFPPRGLIFDIGANHGAKTDVFLRLGARVLAVDPDELNQEILRRTFLQYRWNKKPVTIVGKAVSDTTGQSVMWVDSPGSAKNTLSQKWVDTLREDERRFGQSLEFGQRREVETVTLGDLIAVCGTPFFVKIDVEGLEPSVIRGLCRPVPYLSFEVNLPEFRPEGLECVELLRTLAPTGVFNYAVGCDTGLELGEWLAGEDFSNVLMSCTQPSIEVFWRTAR